MSTATGIALMVDIARLPVYLAGQWSILSSIWEPILVMTIGVITGTIAGRRLLEKIPDNIFKKAVSAVIFLIGILILVKH